ncbi:MAG TPA: DUF2330 domain-containing protein [Polyangiaceae bacterium]|nr:DUF2330 domain-containing protein [Polyangiaceae bacterium]
MRSFLRLLWVTSTISALGTLLPATARACGGLFCNAAQPVNQSAEGIIFADNGDGTTTAVIQIQYQGPSQNFSWLLPISSIPKSNDDIGIASNVALQRLQSATNPSYSLTLRVQGTCREEPSGGGSGCGQSQSRSYASGNRGTTQSDPSTPEVVVEASGVVGAFDWSVISLDKTLSDPAQAAEEWLQAHGYDVPSSAPTLLGPYLKQGMFLLALRLTKGADTGSIRPIVLTYSGAQPSIPVKLTAVAANDDMGVLTWVLGKSRAVPLNYLSLELNEARINWFNSASNYNALVTEAANDAGGQGFVTELAGPTSVLAEQIWTPLDESNWRSLTQGLTDTALFQSALRWFGQWDGFWDATRAVVTIPSGQNIDALKACPACYAVQLSTTDYLAQLEKLVIQPVKRVQSLIDNHPEITRLYTTLSADEMTLDPLFGFNPELPNSSNVHTAERVIVCSPNVYMSEAPWHVDLPGGGVVWGADSIGIWPSQLDTLPPTRTISRASESGESKVIEDNSQAIDSALSQYAAPKSPAADAGGGCAASHGGSRGAWVSFAVFGAALLRRRQRLERRRAKA